jgi:hypothetical protein
LFDTGLILRDLCLVKVGFVTLSFSYNPLVDAPRNLALALCILACGGSTVRSEPVMQAPAVQEQHIKLRLDGPARIGLPIWLYSDLRFPLEARYPFAEDPRYFGSNRLELRRNGEVVEPLSGIGGTGIIGIVVGSIAPPDSPQNRLPLHLGFTIDRPGTYSVRWSVVSPDLGRVSGPPRLLAESDWLDFNVVAPTPGEREVWLTSTLATPPTEIGRYVGDYLPSLLAALPDRRVVQEVLDGLYSDKGLIQSCALGALQKLPDSVTVPAVLESLRRRGPVGGLAYFVSWHKALFQDRRDDIVRTATSYLRSKDDAIVEGALRLLMFARAFDWKDNSTAMQDADLAVEAAAPALAGRGDAVARTLATYLPGIKSPASRAQLWQQAARGSSEREQALIALTWIADPVDLSRIGDLLVQPGNVDPRGTDLASLPYALVRAYGDAAIPYLQRALADSPYVWVRTQSAEQLALKGRVESFRFFLDAITENRFYRAEVVNWFRTAFRLPATASEAEVAAFLNERIRDPQPPPNPSTQK